GSFLADAGDGSEAREIAALDGANQVERLDARKHRERDLGADAADADQPLEQLLLEQGGETVKQERVLAHMRVNPHRDGRTGVAEAVERRQRHEHLVADAVDVDDDSVRMFFEDVAAQGRDHVRTGLTRLSRRSAAGESFSRSRAKADLSRRSASGESFSRSRAKADQVVVLDRAGSTTAAIRCVPAWTWQIAMASASAASCGVGGAVRPSSRRTMCWICALSARP